MHVYYIFTPELISRRRPFFAGHLSRNSRFYTEICVKMPLSGILNLPRMVLIAKHYIIPIFTWIILALQHKLPTNIRYLAGLQCSSSRTALTPAITQHHHALRLHQTQVSGSFSLAEFVNQRICASICLRLCYIHKHIRHPLITQPPPGSISLWT